MGQNDDNTKRPPHPNLPFYVGDEAGDVLTQSPQHPTSASEPPSTSLRLPVSQDSPQTPQFHLSLAMTPPKPMPEPEPVDGEKTGEQWVAPVLEPEKTPSPPSQRVPLFPDPLSVGIAPATPPPVSLPHSPPFSMDPPPAEMDPADFQDLMMTIDTEEFTSWQGSESVAGFVLIVEDDAVSSRLLQIHLEKSGLDTHIARDGQEALQVAEELRPDLIVLDVMMPKMNGFEVCEHIRRIPDLQDVPIIFLTGEEQEQKIIQAYDLGADDYISKSGFKPTILAAKIKQFLRRRQRQNYQSVESLKAGMLLGGRYEILREIGRGGMGVVYLVRHQRLGFPLALKAMNIQRSNREKSQQRFLREIKSLAELHHPNLVRIHDSGEFGQIPYYVMEYIPGGSLYQKLQEQGALSTKEALQIAGKLASGLQAAHECRILHRDLKTENILFRKNGEPVLTDFGLVLDIADESKRLTKVGCVVGTPHYMSPEQITQPNDIDGRSDVFSLGIVLYEMLTGQNPLIHYNRTEVMVKIVTEDIPSPLTHKPDLHPMAVDVCVRALQRKRSLRFPSALAMSVACEQAMQRL